MTSESPGPRDPVGYGMPPVETRFRPGQSGNPKGRPKGAKNIQTIIAEELSQFVTATVNGKRVRLSTAQAIIKRLASSAAGGDLRAAEILLKHGSGNQIGQTPDPAGGHTNRNEQDEAILKRHMARMRATADRKDDDNE